MTKETGLQIGDFTLVNSAKVSRAINGSMGKGGRLVGGLLSELGLTDQKDIPAEKLLAKYDSFGGLILKGENKVKMGSFFDFVKKVPREKPVITFEENVEGRIIEVTEEEANALKSAKAKVEELKNKTIEKEEAEPKKVKKIKK